MRQARDGGCEMTSVLTDEEKKALAFRYGITTMVVDVIEAATIKRLSAGVSVESVAQKTHYPNMHMVGPTDGGIIRIDELQSIAVGTQLSTLSQLQTAIAAARVQENERCCAIAIKNHRKDLADDFRALLGKEAT